MKVRKLNKGMGLELISIQKLLVCINLVWMLREQLEVSSFIINNKLILVGLVETHVQ